MHISLSDPKELLKWGYRLLYLQLFISFMVVMGYWHVSITITFLGSVLALLFPVLFSRKEMFDIEEKEVANTPE